MAGMLKTARLCGVIILVLFCVFSGEAFALQFDPTNTSINFDNDDLVLRPGDKGLVDALALLNKANLMGQ